MKYIWDTNTVIYYLQQQFPQTVEVFIDTILEENQPAISAITEIELLCWKTATENDIVIIKSFISDSVVIELENTVKIKTAEIRKLNRLKLPDAIIAASAMVYDLTLVTRNIKDFQKINNIQLINPWDQ